MRPGHAAGKSIDEGLLDVGVYSVIVDAFTELVAVVVLLGAVLLVEGPGAESYVLGFVTGRSPAAVHEVTGDDGTVGHDEMVSVFVPMAPNPVTGGVLAHVPRDRLPDVDTTVEEGVRSVLTSGIASDRRADGPREVSVDDRPDDPGDRVGQFTDDPSDRVGQFTDDPGDRVGQFSRGVERRGRRARRVHPGRRSRGSGARTRARRARRQLSRVAYVHVTTVAA